jgi:ABC-type multidrug transport system fused ATPase/permease subunit
MADPKSYRSWLPVIVVGAVALVLAERLFLLVSRYAVNIFFSDQWEFSSATVFERHSWWQIFTWQHGPHRQGLGGVLVKWIEPHFQFDSRIESFLVAGILVLAMLLAVWLKYRIFNCVDYYDAAIPSLMLTATQCEVIFGATNLAHGSIPLLLIMLYGLCWTIGSPVPRFAAVLAVNFLLTFTGFGLLMGVVSPIAIVLSLCMSSASRRDLQVHLAALALALLSLAVFFLHYAWNPAVDCFDSALVSRSWLDYLHFAALMCANYAGFDGLTSRHPWVWGGTLLALLSLALLAVVVRIARGRSIAREASAGLVVSFALLAFSIVFCAAVAHGRLCLGFAAAQESRYMPYLTPGFLGAYFCLRQSKARPRIRHAVLAGFLAASAYAGWPVHLGDQLEISGFHSTKLNWKNCYLSTKNISFCNRQVGRRIANPAEAANLQQKLDYLEREHLNLFDGR